VAKGEVENLRFDARLDGCLMRIIYRPMTLPHALLAIPHYLLE
jgi:hypothetical protein